MKATAKKYDFLTDTLIKSLTSDGHPQKDFVDGKEPGLWLRVTSTGTKTWNFAYLSPGDGKRARLKLGTYPATPLAVAREMARKERGLVEQKVDPRDVRKAEEAARAAVIAGRVTMATLIETRLREYIRPKLRAAAQIERRFNHDVLPVVGKVAVTEFSREHLAMVLDPIKQRGSPRAAGLVHADLKATFTYAIQEGIAGLKVSPIAGAAYSRGISKSNRFLTLPEIAIVWNAMPVVFRQSPDVMTILKLLLLTGVRIATVCAMERDQFKFDKYGKPVWEIPALLVKGEDDEENPVEPLAIPLSPAAWAIIEERMRRTNGRFLFPKPGRKGKKHIGEPVIDAPYDKHVVASTLRRAHEDAKAGPLGKFGMKSWTPHDLRRTFTTQALAGDNGLKIDKIDVDRVLNHRSETNKDVTDRHYDMNKYISEKRRALNKWAAFIQMISATSDTEFATWQAALEAAHHEEAKPEIFRFNPNGWRPGMIVADERAKAA